MKQTIRYPQRLLTAILVVLCGCVIESTDTWVAPLEAQVEKPKQKVHRQVVPQKPRTAAPVQLPFTFLWDAQHQQVRGVVVATKPGVYWTSNTAIPVSAAVGSQLENTAAITSTTAGASGTYLFAAGEQSKPSGQISAHDLDLQTTKLIRVHSGTHGVEMESLDVIAVQGSTIQTSCPRTAAGVVFDQKGRWLTAVWALDGQGGCPVLRSF